MDMEKMYRVLTMVISGGRKMVFIFLYFLQRASIAIVIIIVAFNFKKAGGLPTFSKKHSFALEWLKLPF